MSRAALALFARTLLASPLETLPAWLRMPSAPCAECGRLLYPAPVQQQARGMKASRRKVEVIMLEDVRDLRRYTVERVAPGEARNALVPRGQAVYAHYLNRQKFAAEIEAAKASVLHATDGEAEVERQRARDERLLKKLRNMRLSVDVLSDGNDFLEPFKVEDISKEILKTANIVVVPEMIMLSQAFGAPGTYDVPLALLDTKGQQVVLTLQLTPKQASTAQLKTLGLTPKGEDDDA